MSGAQPLVGQGPWSLVEVADALGMSYDTVCRDVRRGVLPARRAPLHSVGRFVVGSEELERAAREAYRRLAPPSVAV